MIAVLVGPAGRSPAGTGGTGAFKGAKGTIRAKNLNKAGTRTAVTVKYHT